MAKKVKRTLAIIVCIILATSYAIAQTLTYQTTDISYNLLNSGWTKYEPCRVLVTVSDTHVIIYSSETQVYRITWADDWRIINGNQQLSIKAIDNEGIRCNLRFVINNVTGYSQIYIDYNDVSICYIVIAI